MFNLSLPKTTPQELSAKPYIALCPDVGPTLAVRNYPKEHFAQVIDKLLELNPNHQIVHSLAPKTTP